MADFLKIGQLIENLTGFVKVKIELLKLEILEEISKGIANLFALVVVLILGLFVLAFASLTIAVLLNNYLDSYYAGYRIITRCIGILLTSMVWRNRSGKLTQIIEDELVSKSKEIMDRSEEDE